jgi:hypothetical protein
MDEAFNLVDYLPMSFKNSGEQEYISFLWVAFETNYENGKYQFAFLAYHMLLMSFVYFNIWQIRQAQPGDFEKGLIGFTGDDETTLLRATSPFAFSKVNERTVLRLFRLVGCDDSRIGNYRKLVDDRNDAAHANGNIFFKTHQEADVQIHQVIRAVEEIQTHSRPLISRCYQEFLLQSHNPEEREYLDSEDQIREVLIHGNYMSRKDIEVCINFDISALEDTDMDAIEALHNALCEAYGSVEGMDKI